MSCSWSSSALSAFLGARKLLLKPASFNQNQITSENGNSQITNTEITTQINNPFLKCEKEDQVAAQTSPDEPEKDSSNLFKPATNLFASHLASAGGNSFVFGQNLHDRVIIVSAIRLIYLRNASICNFRTM